ncbi:uncharacterized protein LOC142780301 isoform X2 [Rhipicephalus microplus]|uniref:uncharacterized protein LOC142780301 isoform X2 n=1 Tax=Rhipicephalus microplus TaxID=6941 RepID=UPI003F6B6A3D
MSSATMDGPVLATGTRKTSATGGSLDSPKLQSWHVLSLMQPRPGSLESMQLRSHQRQHAPSFDVEGDDDGGLDSQDEPRRAKLRGKACYFKICPFNTRTL